MTHLLEKYRSDLAALLIISVFSIVALRALIQNPFYTSHDGFTHTARIAAYYNILKDGQFPPRWADNLHSGLGSPIFVYSYPLPYMIGSLFHSGGISYQDSYRLVLGLGYLFSAIFAYLWLRNRFKIPAALVGAVFYIWVPYKFLNLYVRGALAESLAYTFLPLLFWSVEEISHARNRKRWFIILTFSTAALLLSHNVVAAMMVPVVLVWVALNGLKNSKTTILALGAGLLISSFIYLPDFFERSYIHFDSSISYWRDHFVALRQLIRSPWGYGFDFPGPSNDEMSFQIGLAQLGSLLLIMITFVGLIFQNQKTFLEKHLKEAGFFGLFLIIAIVLMLDRPFVAVIWEHMPVMQTIIDFPWRFLGLTTLCFAFLGAYSVHLLNNSKVVVIFLLGLILVANRNHLNVNLPLDLKDEIFDDYSEAATATSNEYLPVWRKNRLLPPPGIPKVVDMQGKSEIEIIKTDANGLMFNVSSTESAEIRINRFYFPETTIYEGGNVLVKNRDYEVITNSGPGMQGGDTGLIKLYVQPPGGEYELKFRDTRLRTIANWLSAGTLVLVILIATKYAYSVKKR